MKKNSCLNYAQERKYFQTKIHAKRILKNSLNCNDFVVLLWHCWEEHFCFWNYVQHIAKSLPPYLLENWDGKWPKGVLWSILGNYMHKGYDLQAPKQQKGYFLFCRLTILIGLHFQICKSTKYVSESPKWLNYHQCNIFKHNCICGAKDFLQMFETTNGPLW